MKDTRRSHMTNWVRLLMAALLAAPLLVGARGALARGGSVGGRASSFNRTGSFQSNGIVRSTSIAPRYYGSRPSYTRSYYYGGAYYPGYHYGFWSGFSFGWMMASPPWYYWTPFHPAFYYNPPV